MEPEASGYVKKIIRNIIIAAAVVAGVILAVFAAVKARSQELAQTAASKSIRAYYEEYCQPEIERAAEESGFSDLKIQADIRSAGENDNHVIIRMTIESREIDQFASVKDRSPEAAILAGRMKKILSILDESVGELEYAGSPEEGTTYVSFEGNFRKFRGEDYSFRAVEVYGTSCDFSFSRMSRSSGDVMTLAIDEKPVEYACEEHSWDGGTVTKEPDFNRSGLRTYICEVCGAERVESIPQLETTAGTVGVVGNGTYKVLNDHAVRYMAPVKPEAEVKIPASVKIGRKSFDVTSVAADAFQKDETLTKLTIGTNVKKIGSNAFYKCTALETVYISSGVTTIGEKAFCGCTALTTVTMGSKVTEIGDQAFYKCTGLSKISLPGSVETIGRKAFCGCKKLKSVTIYSVKLKTASVGAEAFKGLHTKAVAKVPRARINGYSRLLKKRGLSGEKQKIIAMK